MGVCNCLCFIVRYFMSFLVFCNHLDVEERRAGCTISSERRAIVVWFFFTMPWVCLQFVFVVFSAHTNYFCVCHAFASVHCCLVVTCWERADILALVCDVNCVFVTFPCGILGQVWYVIVSFPDFAAFLTLNMRQPHPLF